MNQKINLSLLSAALLVLAACDSDRREEPGFPPAEEVFRLDTELHEGRITARWEIEPGYYLYRDRMELMAPDDPDRLGAQVFSRDGVVIDDPFLGVQEVFHDSVELSAELRGIAGEEVELLVGFQGCSEAGFCYPPQTRKLTIELPGVESAFRPRG